MSLSDNNRCDCESARDDRDGCDSVSLSLCWVTEVHRFIDLFFLHFIDLFFLHFIDLILRNHIIFNNEKIDYVGKSLSKQFCDANHRALLYHTVALPPAPRPLRLPVRIIVSSACNSENFFYGLISNGAITWCHHLEAGRCKQFKLGTLYEGSKPLHLRDDDEVVVTLCSKLTW